MSLRILLNKKRNENNPFRYGGAYGIRTRDLHTASVARSQLRQYPMHSMIAHPAEKIKRLLKFHLMHKN